MVHLESGSPVKTFTMLGRAATLKDKDTGFFRKTAAGIGAFFNARGLSKHYFGTGIISGLKNALFFFTGNSSETKSFWPKFTAPKDEAQTKKIIQIVENLLSNVQHGKNDSGSKHLAEVIGLSGQSVDGVIMAVRNLLKNPEVKAQIISGNKEVSSKLIRKGLDEAFGVINNITENDRSKIADIISIAISNKPGESVPISLDQLTKYWQTAEPAIESTVENTAHRASLLPSRDLKIAFANKPAVNLGVAVAALGGAILVARHFTKGTRTTSESVDDNGNKVIHTETAPASFWKKTGAFLGASTLLALCGVASFRALAMPNKQGLSFLEKILSPDMNKAVRSV